jgi:3-hydroxyacyl-[acyl-carrier-protein] dehydratase
MSSSPSGIDLLPHQPPMRLVEDVVDIVAGTSARGLRVAHPQDWYFQGHFPGNPVVPAIVLIELLAQTGGLAAMTGDAQSAAGERLRVAAIGPFRFPASARPNQVLEARARVLARFGGIIKIEGEVLADGVAVASGSVTLAEIAPEQPS